MQILSHRPDTQDEVVYRDVIQNNEYRLPPTLGPKDVVIDIGAHIGMFSVACLLRGAGTVLAFEPDLQNFKFLEENLKPKEGQTAEAFLIAVWKPDADRMLFTGYPDQYTACGTILPDATVEKVNKRILVDTCGLDEILEHVAAQNRRVRLLKIDAEFAEYPILYGSKMLALVDQVVMEVHEMPTMPKAAKVKGFNDYTVYGLAQHLKNHGFKVEIEWLREYGTQSAFHLFAIRE